MKPDFSRMTGRAAHGGARQSMRPGKRTMLALAITAVSSGATADFSVSGTQLLDGNGAPFVMRGINHPHAWYTDKTPQAIHDIAATGANTIRVVLSNGHRWERTSKEEVAEIIRLAKENNLVAVLDVHDVIGYGEDEAAAPLSSAVDYWLDIAEVLEGEEDYVIINIGNEPFGNDVPADTWINEHREAIVRLREGGFEHTLIVDAANWGQDWEGIMLAHASTVAEADPLKNTMFSVHMYEVFPERDVVDQYMQMFRESHNLPLLVGEFGMDHYGEPVAAEAIMEMAEQYGVGYTGWSWSGNSGGTESLDLVYDFDPGSFSPWGELLVNGENGLKDTAQPASVFGSVPDDGDDEDDTDNGDIGNPGGGDDNGDPGTGDPGNGDPDSGDDGDNGDGEQPGEPVDPEEPDQPDQPDEPEDPENPDEPGQPDPEDPDNGDEPGEDDDDDGDDGDQGPVAGGSLSCEVEANSFWNRGYHVTVNVTNTSDQPVEGWRVMLQFPQQANATFSWNARLKGRKSPEVTASNMFWNDELAPGESTEFGFLGHHGGEFEAPQCAAEGDVTGGGNGNDDGDTDPDVPVEPPVGDPDGDPGDNPDDPMDPENPDEPSDPEEPTEPEDPVDPDDPMNPDDPSEPEDPTEGEGEGNDDPQDPGEGDEDGDTDEPDNGAGEDHVDNPFADAAAYVNPDYARLVDTSIESVDGELAATMEQIKSVPTAVWMDRIEAIHGGEENDGRMSLRDHLDAALEQKPEGEPITATFVVYNLPDRDCAALASNGTLHADENGLSIYKSEYIDEIAETFADPKYSDIRIVTVVEPDSLPNLVTNLDNPKCAKVQQDGTYVEGIRYAIQEFADLPNVYTYLDIAHSGWLGWPNNFDPAVQLYTTVVSQAAGGDLSVVDGFVSNVANYTPTEEQHLPDPEHRTGGGDPIRAADFYEWNPMFDEMDFTEQLRQAFINAGFPETIGMLIDTSRNGWGGDERPDGAAEGESDINQYVDASRVDRRHHRGNWCNPDGAGIGLLPQVSPLGEDGHLDAYVWIKPPGESDGTSDANQTEPDEEGKSFDEMCSPEYTAESGYPTGAMAGAPPAGHWFHEQFRMLVENAHTSADE